MQKVFLRLLFAAALVLALSGTTGSQAAGPESRAVPSGSQAPRSLRLVERATGETVIHRTASNDALGDLLVFANPLYDAANVSQVGTSRGSCTRVEVGHWWDCHWTMALAGGALLVAGPYPDEGDAAFGIVGGTGHYAGARGTITVHARDTAHQSYDFVIALQ
ncbi:MAG TPA: dirigent protein [Steroidobacteraceae bacterium]|nr:dirigent protein [Steroidobacteraceae bacterium]